MDKISYINIMNHCYKCNVELMLGMNFTPSREKSKYFICSPCLSIQDKEKYKQNKSQMLKTINLYRHSIPAGVYCIKDLDKKIVYIGESKTPIVRRDYHFGKKTVRNISIPAQYIQGNKENYSFELLVKEKDKVKRLKIEDYFIKKYKPEFNIKNQ